MNQDDFSKTRFNLALICFLLWPCPRVPDHQPSKDNFNDPVHFHESPITRCGEHDDNCVERTKGDVDAPIHRCLQRDREEDHDARYRQHQRGYHEAPLSRRTDGAISRSYPLQPAGFEELKIVGIDVAEHNARPQGTELQLHW
jgi:hypothetical protein